jgi:hypothetical protein
MPLDAGRLAVPGFQPVPPPGQGSAVRCRSDGAAKRGREELLRAAFESFRADPPSPRSFARFKRWALARDLPAEDFGSAEALYGASVTAAFIRLASELRGYAPPTGALPSVVASGYAAWAEQVFKSPTGTALAWILLRDGPLHPSISERYERCAIGPASEDLARFLERAGRLRELELVVDRSKLRSALIGLHWQVALLGMMPEMARAAIASSAAPAGRTSACVLEAVSAADPLGLGRA